VFRVACSHFAVNQIELLSVVAKLGLVWAIRDRINDEPKPMAERFTQPSKIR
jgi:hypothetical protein